VRKNVFYLRNIPTGMTTYGLELLYGDLCPVSIHWKTNASAWLTVKHENRVELAKPGVLGLEVLKPFIEDDTKFSIASNNGITLEAANIEMLTSQEYHDLHRAHGTVSDRNGNITLVHQTVTTPEILSPVATGGTSYDGKGRVKKILGWGRVGGLADCQFLLNQLLFFILNTDLDFEIPASLQQSHKQVAAEVKVSAKRGYVDLDTPVSSDAHVAKKQHR
jgi:hypothetical protein